MEISLHLKNADFWALCSAYKNRTATSSFGYKECLNWILIKNAAEIPHTMRSTPGLTDYRRNILEERYLGLSHYSYELKLHK